jgi:1A family penicillin-binding protein
MAVVAKHKRKKSAQKPTRKPARKAVKKSTRNRPAEFLESLGATPTLPAAPKINWPTLPALPNLPSSLPAMPGLGVLNHPTLWQDATALLHDSWMYGRRAVGQFFSKRARLAYSVMALAVVGAIGFAGVKIAATTLTQYSSELANPAFLLNQKDVGTTITDRNGVVLFQGYGAVNRQDIPFTQMPTSIKQATLAAEDPGFYSEPGFSVRGTARAALQDITHDDAAQGGSTITQQLVKNTLLNDQKSLTRKYQEVVLSVDLNQRYSKDQILQMYLNTVYYGEGAYGIESAAETYFHKPAKDLTLEESATLAGLPQSPSLYDPAINPDGAKTRRDYVLDRMQQYGYASPQAVSAAKAAPMIAGTADSTIKAPHFVFYVLSLLQQQYGENEIEHGGITVRTTLDYSQQQKAQAIVTNQVASLSSHHVTNGGMISVDPHNGDILTMVGSVNYNQPGWGAVNTMLSQLQPGSSFKPIAYAEAFLKGWSGATEVNDEPMCWPVTGQAPYCPQDYSQKWSGPVLLRHALGNSLNIPALQVLAHAGLADTIALGHAMGIQSPSLGGNPNQYGLPLVLGAGDVRPIDMAAVYATFDEGGKTVVPRAILSVQDKYGQDITKPQTTGAGQQVLDPRVAYMITNLLSDNQARQPEFGLSNPLVLPGRPAAAKTGTTNDFDDNWTDGYTPNLVAVVWVGNNDHSPMQDVSGITGAAPIWQNYMEMATAGTPVEQFAVPAGVVFAKVCPSDGGLDTNPNDPNAINEVFLAGQAPTQPCGAVSPEPIPSGAYTPGGSTQIVSPTATTATPTTTTTTTPAATAPGQGSGGTTPSTPSTPTTPTEPTPPTQPTTPFENPGSSP